MIGHSFLHSGPRLTGLSPAILHVLLGGTPQTATITLEDVADLDIKETIRPVCSKKCNAIHVCTPVFFILIFYVDVYVHIVSFNFRMHPYQVNCGGISCHFILSTRRVMLTKLTTQFNRILRCFYTWLDCLDQTRVWLLPPSLASAGLCSYYIIWVQTGVNTVHPVNM